MSRGSAIVLLGLVGAVAGGPLAALSIVAVLLLGIEMQRRSRARQRVAALRRALPTALDLLVVGAEAGLTPHHVVGLLHRSGPDPLRAVFGSVVERVDRGESLADALGELPARLGAPAVAATDAIALAERHGAPLTQALMVVAAEAARQRRSQADAAARSLPVKLSFPLVVCVLPAFVLLAIAPAVLGALRSVQDTGW